MINQRAIKEVNWRYKHKNAIITIAMFAGIEPCIIASNMSKKIDGGRPNGIWR